MASGGLAADGDGVELSARHLLVCQQVFYDPFQRGAAFSLRGLIVSIEPNDDIGYPITFEELALFAQVYGDPGESQVWAELYEIPDDGDEVKVIDYGPFSVRVRPGRFVEGVHMRLLKVPFPRPGLYEFRLRREGDDEFLITERLLVKE